MCHVIFDPLAAKTTSPGPKVSTRQSALVIVSDPEMMVIISFTGYAGISSLQGGHSQTPAATEPSCASWKRMVVSSVSSVVKHDFGISVEGFFSPIGSGKIFEGVYRHLDLR
jgi:hypothetical protein